MAYREPLGISVAQLKVRLRDNPSGAFAFYGPEEMLKQFYVQKLEALVEKEGFPEFNLAKLDCTRDHTLSHVWDEAQILPFGGERRVVVCRGLNPAKLSTADEKILTDLLTDIPPYLTLVFSLDNEMFPSDKATLENKKVKALAQKMTFVSFPLQEEKVLLTWSRKILAADGLTASDKTLRTLFSLCSNRMQTIRGELEKLIAFAVSQKRGEVTEDDVLLFTCDTVELALYNLCDAVLEGAVDQVEKIYANLKRQQVKPLNISAALARTLTNALLVLEGADAASCQSISRLASWQFDRYRRLLYGKKKEWVEEAMSLCLELDGKVKGYRSDADLVTETTLIRIALILRGRT